MGNEEKKKASEQIGTLGGCLIEGDSEQKARERKVKRRALMMSIGLQSAALVALVVTPLLAKPEKLLLTKDVFMPMPPYHHTAPKPAEPHPTSTPPKTRCAFCAPTKISPVIVTHDPATTTKTVDEPGIDIGRTGDTPPSNWGLREPTGHNGPEIPDDPDKSKKKRISVGGAVQQAMLVRRVDPVYPALAKTLHRAGQVHIKATISTEGSIESLQALDGDPLLIQSALEAVRQWRYKPTLLNGSPVEVDTVITVVYTLNQ